MYVSLVRKNQPIECLQKFLECAALGLELLGGGKRGSSAEALGSKRIIEVEPRCPDWKKSEFRGMRNTVLHNCCKLGAVLILCLNRFQVFSCHCNVLSYNATSYKKLIDIREEP